MEKRLRSIKGYIESCLAEDSTCSPWLEGWIRGVTDPSLTLNKELYDEAMEFLKQKREQKREEALMRNIKAAIEVAKAAKLEVKKDLAMALEDTGIVTRYGSPIRLPLEDGSQVSLDLRDNLFDPEDENDGYCHIAIIPSDVSKDEYTDEMDIDYNADGYEMCPEPELVAKAIELELRRELRALQEWNKRVAEITRLLP